MTSRLLHNFLFPRRWRLRVKFEWLMSSLSSAPIQLYSKVGGQKDQSILRKFSPPRARCGAISYKITKMLTKRSWAHSQFLIALAKCSASGFAKQCTKSRGNNVGETRHFNQLWLEIWISVHALSVLMRKEFPTCFTFSLVFRWSIIVFSHENVLLFAKSSSND